MDNTPWHVLHVQTNHEKRVIRHLSVRSAEFYLPLYSERVKWSDRTVLTERPLFPGYIFLRNPPKQKSIYLSIPGVFRLLGDEPRDLVPEEEMKRVRQGLKENLPLRPHIGLAIGSRVRILRGAFQGVFGVVKELCQNCEVILKLGPAHHAFTLRADPCELDLLHDSSADTHGPAADKCLSSLLNRPSLAI